jgi:ribosomal protein L37AE/L43A
VGCFICDGCAALQRQPQITDDCKSSSSKDVVDEEQKPDLECPICDAQGALDSKGQGVGLCVDCTVTINTGDHLDKVVTFVDDAVQAVLEKALEAAEEGPQSKVREAVCICPALEVGQEDTERVRERRTTRKA